MGSTKSLQRLVLMLSLAFSFVAAMPTFFTGPARTAQITTVTISDLAFDPQNVTIKVGSAITWINNDPLIYTLWFVKADDGTTYKKAGKEGLSDPILPDTSWSQSFNEIVTLQYYSFERLWITGFITVVPLVPPTASFTYSPGKPTIGQMVTFNASASIDPDGTIISHIWDFGDDSTDTGIIVTHTYSAAGTYTVNLTVTDDDGLTDTESKSVSVIEAPVASFTYSPEKPLVGETVTFDASSSTPNSGTITSYTWDFDDGSPIDTETEPATTHIYVTYGTFNVTLTVTDSEGLTDAESKFITVCEPPVAAFTYAPTTPLVGENVAFNTSQSTDADGIIQSYFWDFDDGVTEIYVEGINLTAIANHVYASQGTYNVTLTVTDNDDLMDSVWKTVTVLPIHDVAVVPPIKVGIVGEGALSAGTISVTSGENITITVDVKNEGTVAETFTVTVYSNDTAIDTQTVTNLAAGSSETLEFVWDTTDVAEGNYVTKAEASQVAGETDTADNTLTSDVTVAVKRKALIFPSIEIIGLIVLTIAIIALGLGAYIYIKRKKITKSKRIPTAKKKKHITRKTKKVTKSRKKR